MGKVAIVGLGPSQELFNISDYEVSIGVNDIWKYHKTPVIVCLDREKRFTPQRLKIINESKPEAFYSQVINWDHRPDFVHILIRPGYPEKVCVLDRSMMVKSYCSPFVACQIAFWYYGATEIHVYGVDFTNHPNLNRDICKKIKIHFQNLERALNEKGCNLKYFGDGILTE